MYPFARNLHTSYESHNLLTGYDFYLKVSSNGLLLLVTCVPIYANLLYFLCRSPPPSRQPSRLSTYNKYCDLHSFSQNLCLIIFISLPSYCFFFRYALGASLDSDTDTVAPVSCNISRRWALTFFHKKTIGVTFQGCDNYRCSREVSSTGQRLPFHVTPF